MIDVARELTGLDGATLQRLFDPGTLADAGGEYRVPPSWQHGHRAGGALSALLGDPAAKLIGIEPWAALFHEGGAPNAKDFRSSATLLTAWLRLQPGPWLPERIPGSPMANSGSGMQKRYNAATR